MQTRHDFNKPDCPKNEPEELATHSDGRVFYKCKNCSYVGTMEKFTLPFHTSDILQQIQSRH